VDLIRRLDIAIVEHGDQLFSTRETTNCYEVLVYGYACRAGEFLLFGAHYCSISVTIDEPLIVI
jgi:hypothetical protein